MLTKNAPVFYDHMEGKTDFICCTSQDMTQKDEAKILESEH